MGCIPIEATTEIYTSNSAGHTCGRLLSEPDKLMCWGYNGYQQTDVELLSPIESLTSVWVGGNVTCISDSFGVRCIGEDDNGQISKMPASFDGLHNIVIGREHMCALDSNGVQCWGIDDPESNYDFGQVHAPTIEAATELVGGTYTSCGLGINGVKCWGHGYSGQDEIPSLGTVTQLISGGGHICAFDGEWLCWGENYYQQANSALMEGYDSVSLGVAHNCGVTDGIVNCWGGDPQEVGLLEPPEMSNVTDVKTAYWHNCAVTPDGVKCWGKNNHGQTEVPSELVLEH